MSRIYENMTEMIGKTPLLKLNKYGKDVPADLIAKMECFNPGGSAKDRVALAMIEEAEQAGELRPGATIIEPTSGNTGVGLAAIASVKGYNAIFTMPDTMSMERRTLLTALGAEIVLTPGADGMNGAIQKASELAAEIDGAFIPAQFDNPANPKAHRETTGIEIWEDTDGKIDVFVASVGTGGTITGAGEFLKSKNPNIEVVAVEPFESPVLSGGNAGPHKIQGIGAGFVPKVLNEDIYDEVFAIKGDDAFEESRAFAMEEGMLVGISSGAVLKAMKEIGKRAEFEGKTIVGLLPDTGERYLSTELYK